MKRTISKALKGQYFNIAVDLGCGEGYLGETLKQHVRYLIGVDHNIPRLSVAQKFGGYDRVVWSEIQEYELPGAVDAVFMFEAIEHLTSAQGFALLNRLSNIPFVMLTTPDTFFKEAIRNHHQSFWSASVLSELYGFTISKFSYSLVQSLKGIKGVLAIRDTRSGGIL